MKPVSPLSLGFEDSEDEMNGSYCQVSYIGRLILFVNEFYN